MMYSIILKKKKWVRNKEEKNNKTFRRSIYFTKDAKKGEKYQKIILEE